MPTDRPLMPYPVEELKRRNTEGLLMKNWNLSHFPPAFMYSITLSMSVKALYILLIYAFEIVDHSIICATRI